MIGGNLAVVMWFKFFLMPKPAKCLGRCGCETVARHDTVFCAGVLRSFVPRRDITHDHQPLASCAFDHNTPKADHHRSTLVVDVVGEYRDADNMFLHIPILVPLRRGIATSG